MILCDRSLCELLHDLVDPSSSEMVNPASIDIRVGYEIFVDTPDGLKKRDIPEGGYSLGPGDFALIETYEQLKVPNGYAMEVRLKSTMARLGLDLALAIWFDPGWRGIATLEIRNNRRYANIILYPQQRIAQVMVHKLDGESIRPYEGKYNHARGVEEAKPT